MNGERKALQIEALELDLLLEALWRWYHHDLRNYARAHLTRRFRHALEAEGYDHFGAYQHALLADEKTFRRLLDHLAIRVTEMFRDPPFFAALDRWIGARGKAEGKIKCWVAGCATGEEAYSLAILFRERGLLDRVTIYATDYNDQLLERARQGVYSLEKVRTYTTNYNKMGGKGSLSDHYSLQFDRALFDDVLRHSLVFSRHNLVGDGSFGEMDLILCRNVMIYFDPVLQQRALDLFYDSLKPQGLLGMGLKESLHTYKKKDRWVAIDETLSLYEKRSLSREKEVGPL